MSPYPIGNETPEAYPYIGQFFDRGGAFFNVMHPDFGAVGDGVTDDGPAWNLALAALPSDGGVIVVPPGDYALTTAFSFGAATNALLWILPGVTLSGEALPAASGENQIVDWRDGQLNPGENDGASLGIATKAWSDLFLASGGVINWDNGDVTLTHDPDGFLTLTGQPGEALRIETGVSQEGHAVHAASTQVVHGATHIAPTNVYAYIGKADSGAGGGVFGGLKELGSTAPGVVLAGTADQPDTVKSAVFADTRAIIELQALVHDGAGASVDVSTGGNIVGVATRRGGAIERIWILDESGSTWQPGDATIEGDLSIPEGQITSGTYTPTLSDFTNLDGSTAFLCQWMRVGDVVTVSGTVSVDPTSAASTILGISLPIASAFTNSIDCAGVGHAVAFAEGGAIYADDTNDIARMQWIASETGDHVFSFTFTYRII